MSALETFLKTAAGLPKMPQYRGASKAPAATAAAASSTVLGTKIWKTVTAISKATVGSNAAAASTGTGDIIGVRYNISDAQGLCFVGGTIEAVTINDTTDAFTPTTTPSATTYKLLINVAA